MGCMLSHLASKFAFFPPSPATYQIKKRDGDGALTVVSSSSATATAVDDNSLDVLMIDTKCGNKIVAFYLRNPYARLTLLYSHGNAADLGQLYDLFLQLKLNLRVNLMGYDYSGYGASTGKPSESNTYADIEAVYECLETEYGVSQEDLILYGQSVGSGPTLHLAAKLPRLRGVVLHSAILSGLRVLCHVKFNCCFDIYKNINKIKKVKCPVLVIHGTEDDVVNWLHGNGLWKMAREPYDPLWVKGGGHCNLELYPDYIRHLGKFIQEMENVTTKIRLKKIRQALELQTQPCTCAVSCNKCCCKVKCWRPKCPKCSRPSCTKCSIQIKRSDCCWKPRCTRCCWWQPKCPECVKCCCWKPKCPECVKCCFRKPKCPECVKCCSCKPKCPECLKCCFRKPKCPECVKCCSCKPKCPECECVKCCFCKPKCPECECLKCCFCKPKCPECECVKCCSCKPKCPECVKCCYWKPKCPECVKCCCWKPKFPKLNCFSCFNGGCCSCPSCCEWRCSSCFQWRCCCCERGNNG